MNRKNILWVMTAFVVVTLFCIVSGCHPVGPDYQQPEVKIADSWQSPIEHGLCDELADPNAMAAWWVNFNDPVLTDMIVKAIDGNKNLKVAHSRVLQARAALGIESSELYPKLNLAASGQWVRKSDTGETTDTVSLLQRDKYYQLYSAGLDSSWEIDFFGGIRRSLEAAQASLDATEADMYDALITLSAEVAVNYINLRQCQQQLGILEQSIKLQQEAHDIIRWRYESGVGDEMAVHQSEYNLKNSRAQLPELNTAIQQACNRLAVLLGEQPGVMQDKLCKAAYVPDMPYSIAVGVPADIIRRRPDIRSAESRLMSQTAKIGVARADLYPHLVLNGSISTSATAFHDLGENVFDADAWVIQGGPQIVWNLFNAGAVRNNIKVQTHMQHQALLNYEQAVLSACEDVENAIVGFSDEHDRFASLTQAVNEARQAADLAECQYKSGMADFSIVLDSKRTLLSFENQQAQSKGAMTLGLIKLYKSLGGGWDSGQLAQN